MSSKVWFCPIDRSLFIRTKIFQICVLLSRLHCNKNDKLFIRNNVHWHINMNMHPILKIIQPSIPRLYNRHIPGISQHRNRMNRMQNSFPYIPNSDFHLWHHALWYRDMISPIPERSQGLVNSLSFHDYFLRTLHKTVRDCFLCQIGRCSLVVDHVQALQPKLFEACYEF